MTSPKILSLSQLAKTVENERAGKTVVTTNGAFDILHAGHVDSLTRAKALGDTLIVLVNSDRSVRENKGEKRPVNGEEERAFVLAALSCVDYVAIFDEKDPRAALAAIKPDIHAKGADRTMDEIIERAIVEENGGKVVLLPHTPGISTTNVIKRILDAYGA